ncbi:Coatomer beta subunit [Parasponia andersonii]|uniref:Coatomer beta subunit n=1 Tax=Parasponia andersonii TaxID=3476 RepID=A0A2P5AXD8_PARAD|nr:Coatomer beta subunit [Parasponia andersonii]
MEDASLLELCVSEDVIQTLCSASNSSTLEKSLELLIEVSRTADGRADLASKNILPMVIQLIQSLPYPSGRQFLVLSLRLLRNLCAGEISNQNLFLQKNGFGAVLNVFRSARLCSAGDHGFVHIGLQVVANVSLAGEEHQRLIWHELFPQEFLALAKIQSREVCDPLCMVIYTCCDGNPELLTEICNGCGLPILREIVRTTAAVGFGEDWLKLLLSRIFLEQLHTPPLFSELSLVGPSAAKVQDFEDGDIFFSPEQAFLLRMISEILNERIEEITVPNDFALFVLEIFKSSIGVINSESRTKSGLPTGSTAIDVLGYSLTILRDICAQKGPRDSEESLADAVDTLISSGLVGLLLRLLQDLELPAMIRKTMKQGANQEGTRSSFTLKPCLYKGFRRDIVAVIGNCAYGRKHVQDEIRQKNGILLLLQQCVTDEDNPFLREWGIWSVRNLLEGNAENQRVVAELELQGSVDTPEISGLGLRVEVDPSSRRAKLVNIS